MPVGRKRPYFWWIRPWRYIRQLESKVALDSGYRALSLHIQESLGEPYGEYKGSLGNEVLRGVIGKCDCCKRNYLTGLASTEIENPKPPKYKYEFGSFRPTLVV